MDTDCLKKAAEDCNLFLSIEDGCLKGGLYGALCEWAMNEKNHIQIESLGLPDRFVEQGTQKELRRDCGMACDGILAKLKEIL
jgi:1-deoxy-D-xylulose-5-phosphate synthase